YGTEGQIRVAQPWLPSKEGGTTKIVVERKGESPHEIEIVNEHHLYALEADEAGRSIKRRQSPRMCWADSMGALRTLDRWRKEIGLVYNIEQPGKVPVAHGGALELRKDAAMTYARIAGIDKDISRLVMGADNQE